MYFLPVCTMLNFPKIYVKKKIYYLVQVFTNLVQNIPGKPTLSMTNFLDSSSKYPPRSRD